MIDAYLRNGELFLEEESIEQITEEIIRKAYLCPVDEMAGGIGVSSEEEAVSILMAFGFNVPRNRSRIKILQSLTKTVRGTCSICGRRTKVAMNKAFIFPFERKVDSIVNEKNRLTFCMEHAFKLYSAMAYLYVVPTKKVSPQKWEILKFFFDGPERELRRFKNTFKRSFWLDRFSVEAIERNGKRRYSLRLSLTLSRYHPNEAFFAVLHEFVKHMRNRELLAEAVKSGRAVRVYLIYGSGQFYGERVIEGTTLEKLMDFLGRIQDNGRETNWGRKHLEPRDSAVYLFYENLEMPRNKKDRSKNFLEREEFIGKLLSGKFDFVLLNGVFMERVKAKLPLPPYYYAWAHSFMEVFGGGVVDARTFERINGLGYALGKGIKGTNLERYQWELFRSRGFEEFLNKLVELQAKLEISLDLRPIYENEKEWKVVKAVLLNGILNALHDWEVSRNEGD